MDNIETGLYLPIRFYLTSSEQDRYKRHSLGVALTELNYPHVDCESLAPFQLVYEYEGYLSTVEINLICADSNEVIALPYNVGGEVVIWDDIITADGLHHLSFFGNAWFGGYTSNGRYYLEVKIILPVGDPVIYYSDIFVIANCPGVSDGLHSMVSEFSSTINVSDLKM